ncbi:hypothetical protein [Naasia sp. SYSU D00948]|uniref:hypothetical protein n=1 Tax=Naasia sp. SYSU D00948 TaxID=2817379 RepID=UPI001B303DB8|nr:hypothetical protein [Naasia sp. SYSU D00948]
MRQSFAQWLGDQTGRDDEIGEFARRTLEQGDLPEHGNKAIFDGFFETTRNQPAYERAWAEFEAIPNPGGARSES